MSGSFRVPFPPRPLPTKVPSTVGRINRELNRIRVEMAGLREENRELREDIKEFKGLKARIEELEKVRLYNPEPPTTERENVTGVQEPVHNPEAQLESETPSVSQNQNRVARDQPHTRRKQARKNRGSRSRPASQSGASTSSVNQRNYRTINPGIQSSTRKSPGQGYRPHTRPNYQFPSRGSQSSQGVAVETGFFRYYRGPIPGIWEGI